MQKEAVLELRDLYVRFYLSVYESVEDTEKDACIRAFIENTLDALLFFDEHVSIKREDIVEQFCLFIEENFKDD